MPYGLNAAPATHWWCPVPGAPVSYMEQFFGCPVDANGLAPAGGQPSDAVVNPILYSGYPSPPAPLPVGSTAGGAPIPVVPASGDAAQQTIDTVLAENKAANDAAYQGFFSNVASGNAADYTVGGLSAWVWIGIAGLGAFALVAMGGGSPRRYGR